MKNVSKKPMAKGKEMAGKPAKSMAKKPMGKTKASC
jgi:hypothetical protein